MTTAPRKEQWLEPGVALIATALAGLAAFWWLAIPTPAVMLAVAVFATIVVAVGLRVPAPGPRHCGIGPANRVTLLRGVLIAGLAGLLPYPELAGDHALSLLAIAALALILDGADGWLARRHGIESDFGARFDMELDAVFILVLCLLVWLLGQTGPWVLLIGLMRYAFVLAGWLQPILRRPLPPSRRRKAVCVLQVGALMVCLAPIVPPYAATVIAATALAALSVSFALDVRWLLRHAGPTAATEGTS